MNSIGKMLLLLSLLWLTWYSTGHEWIFILDETNLIFHEAGHFFFAPFGEVLSMMGGSLFQILIPLVVAISFLTKAQLFSASVSLWWMGESMLGVARYIADARTQALQLLGGDHDWAVILAHWPHSMQCDTAIGAVVRTIGFLMMVGALVIAMYLFYKESKNTHT